MNYKLPCNVTLESADEIRFFRAGTALSTLIMALEGMRGDMAAAPPIRPVPRGPRTIQVTPKKTRVVKRAV